MRTIWLTTLLVPLTAALPLETATSPANDLHVKTARKVLAKAAAELAESTELFVDHGVWATAWQVKSKHFIVRTTWGRKWGLDVGKGLDTMLGHFTKLLKPDFKATQRFRVFILPDLPQYNAFGDTNGEHHSSILGSFFAGSHAQKPVAAQWHPNETLVRMWATHSALHQFLASAYPGQTAPTWLEEGLASYFSFYWDQSYGKAQFEKLLSDNTYIALSGALGTQLPQYQDMARAHIHFIELGMLVHYLIHDHPLTRQMPQDGQDGEFLDYARRVLAGESVNDHPVHTLIFNQTAELERDLRRFVTRK